MTVIVEDQRRARRLGDELMRDQTIANPGTWHDIVAQAFASVRERERAAVIEYILAQHLMAYGDWVDAFKRGDHLAALPDTLAESEGR